jgi:hypothetical protein
VDVVEHLDADLPDRVVPDRRERREAHRRMPAVSMTSRTSGEASIAEVHERPHRPRWPGEGAGARRRRAAQHRLSSEASRSGRRPAPET